MSKEHTAIARPQKTFSYVDVALVYMKARAANKPVQQAVAQHYEIAIGAAGKRIHEARRRGLIPKVKQ